MGKKSKPSFEELSRNTVNINDPKAKISPYEHLYVWDPFCRLTRVYIIEFFTDKEIHYRVGVEKKIIEKGGTASKWFFVDK